MRRHGGRVTSDAAAVTAALQTYADRGVFRGFRATPLPRGRTGFQFVWLTRHPMTATFDPRTRTLTFPAVFPDLDAQTAADLKGVVSARQQGGGPAHKRMDARRARLAAAMRRGGLTLAVAVRGGHHAYAVAGALNVINEMFVLLHERHPEYLAQQFGVSTE